MTEIFKSHKKLCIFFAVLLVVVFAVYLFALFKPGYWYRDAFLYKKSEMIFGSLEVYSGHDSINNVDYEMTMVKEGIKTHISFTVNETERYYEIISDDSKSHYPAVKIYENGELVFTGTYMEYLFDENDKPYVETPQINYYTPGALSEEELLPTYNWLYEVSQRVKTDIRGNALWLIFIVVFAGVIALDMIYPDLFWELDHRLSVEGGKPSDYYRFWQKARWAAAPFIIIAAMIASFVVKI